jgi:hypothetical protein
MNECDVDLVWPNKKSALTNDPVGLRKTWSKPIEIIPFLIFLKWYYF